MPIRVTKDDAAECHDMPRFAVDDDATRVDIAAE